jgi:hypothetical protein
MVPEPAREPPLHLTEIDFSPDYRSLNQTSIGVKATYAKEQLGTA